MSCLKLFPFDKERMAELRAAALGDAHLVLFPTHAVMDAGEMVGYASVCATPTVNVWLHSKKVNALNSVKLLGHLEAALRMQGLREYIMPCSKESPFFPNMVRLGFVPLGENVSFHKDLTKD